jgi:hypothetical protein
MILIKTTSNYFYEKKRDIFILQIKDQGSGLLMFDKEHEENIKLIEEYTSWFKKNNIIYERVAPEGLMVGWLGHFYIDFGNFQDPNLIEYCRVFETDDGKSNHPDKYQMYFMSYDEWVAGGGIERHENDDWEY